MTGSDQQPEPHGQQKTTEPERTPVPARSPAEALRRRRRVASVAAGGGIVLFGLLVLLLGRLVSVTPPGPELISSSEPPPQTNTKPSASTQQLVLEWEDDSGTRLRATVDRGRYDAFATVERRRLEQRLPQLADAVAIRVRAAMAPIFVEVEGRVPRFADWVFDWWTSWILLGRAMRWTWDGVATGHVLTMPDKVQAQLIAAIEMRYVELVLQPAVAELKLTDALDRVVTSLRDDLAEECRGHETALRAFIATAPARVERLDAGGNWVRAPDWNGSHASVRLRCGADVGAEDALMRDEISNYRESRNINAPVNEVILRLSRPFATKLISFVVLPVIVAALIGGFALPLLGVLPNVISGVIAGVLTGAVGAAIIGFSASASVDWVLTRTDERINRAGFEVQVRRAVITGRRDFEGNITDAQRRLIERQLLAIAAAGPAQAAHP